MPDEPIIIIIIIIVVVVVAVSLRFKEFCVFVVEYHGRELINGS